MRSLVSRWVWSLTPAAPGRSKAKTSPGVEPLEGRTVLSYLIVPRGDTFVPVHVANARLDEPLFSNGLAAKKAPHFYPYYTGPQRPELNGVKASGYVKGTNLILTGTVDGPIVTKPKTAAMGAIYSFAIDRGGASHTGPFPGRGLIRFDAIVNVTITTKKITATDAATAPMTNQPGVKPTSIAAKNVSIKGDTVKVTVPLADLPSNGHAIDQWNVNFFSRNPSPTRKPPLLTDFHSIASFTPEHTMFQIYVKPPTF